MPFVHGSLLGIRGLGAASVASSPAISQLLAERPTSSQNWLTDDTITGNTYGIGLPNWMLVYLFRGGTRR